MINIKKRRARFIQVSHNALNSKQYANLHCINLKNRIIISGLLNEVWDLWNSFWREYWLLHIQGGIYFDNSSISPISIANRQDSLYYMLYLVGKRSNPTGTVIGSYQEATWGDIDNIVKLASHPNLQSTHTHLNYVATLLSTYSNSTKDFQIIRNAFIHLDKDNINNINSISNRYTFSGNQNTLSILDSTNIISSKRAFEHLIDDMTGLLLNL